MTGPSRIVVLGGGFAGLWAAAAAVRCLDQQGVTPESVRVTLVNRDRWHALRVRNYEPDLHDVRVPLDEVLDAISVDRVEAEVEGIDLRRRLVRLQRPDGTAGSLGYDRLVVALGSVLNRPPLPGLDEHAHDVDTTTAALRLDAHLHTLSGRPADTPGRATVAVVGAGLTGLETVMEMPARLRSVLGADAAVRVLLLDQRDEPGADLGPAALPHLRAALASQQIEFLGGVSVAEVTPEGLRLDDGERIAAATVVWCGGVRAHPLAAQLVGAGRLDAHGRVPVDEMLRVVGQPHVYVAGDMATCWIDGAHASVMSCQHARPMGRYAGWNAAASLCERPPLPLHIAQYVTVVDLGPWGGLYLQGWDRRVVATGAAAKQTKRTINRERIVPPRGGDRAAILQAAAPVVQPPPARVGAAT